MRLSLQAVWLTEKNIICHCEGYKQGIASNHGDVMHWFPKHGKSMDTFRLDVKAEYGGLELTAEAARFYTSGRARFTPPGGHILQ